MNATFTYAAEDYGSKFLSRANTKHRQSHDSCNQCGAIHENASALSHSYATDTASFTPTTSNIRSLEDM